jgi:hypothetical protein
VPPQGGHAGPPLQRNCRLTAPWYKISDDIGQFVTGDHQVQMVVQDDISLDLQALMLTAKLEGVHEKVKIGFPGEEGNPFNHRAGDEVGGARFSDAIAGSHGAWGL